MGKNEGVNKLTHVNNIQNLSGFQIPKNNRKRMCIGVCNGNVRVERQHATDSANPSWFHYCSSSN